MKECICKPNLKYSSKLLANLQESLVAMVFTPQQSKELCLLDPNQDTMIALAILLHTHREQGGTASWVSM